MSDENVGEVSQQVPPEPDLMKEIQELKSQVGGLQQAKTDLEQAYTRDLGVLTQYANQMMQPQQQQAQVDPNDPEVQQQIKLRQIVDQAIDQKTSPIVAGYFQSQRVREKQLAYADPKLKEVLDDPKMSAEVEALINSQPAEVQGKVGIYEAATKAVAALHMDEITERRISAREAARTATAQQEQEENTPRYERNSEFTPPVMSPPTGATRPTQAAPSQTRKFAPLDADEKHMAEVMGVSHSDYDTYSRDLTADVFGFRDPKTGKQRSRV